MPTVKIYKSHKVQNGQLFNINYSIVDGDTITTPEDILVPVRGGAKKSLECFLNNE